MLSWLSWLKWISIFRYGMNVRCGKKAECEHRCELLAQICPFSFHLSVYLCLCQAAFIIELTDQVFYDKNVTWVLRDTHTHIQSNAHAQTDTHALTESLVCVAASLGSCFWKARRSTTQRGASGRMRWPFVQSYWSACPWHTCSYDESTAGNNAMMSVCLFLISSVNFYLIYQTDLTWKKTPLLSVEE